MGTYKPGVTYIHESPDGGKTVYAREAGTTERTLVGYSLPTQRDPLDDHEKELWLNIREAAKTDPTLQRALEQCKILYYLSKQKEPIDWHPV